MKQKTSHRENLVALKRIEGQIRGVQKMIEEERYCVDILIQLRSVVGAILKVEDKIFRKHIEGCVAESLKGKSEVEKLRKIEEVITLIHRFRKV